MVITFVIKMNKSALDLGQSLDFQLKRFTYIMRLSQFHIFRENDVNFYQEIITKMKGSDCVNLFNIRMMIQCNPC